MVLSGLIQEVTNWSWVMMFYSFGSFLFVILTIVVKVSEILRCCEVKKEYYDSSTDSEE